VLGAPSTINLSSATARSARARVLADLACAPQIDWHRLIEELAIRVFEHQDRGDPATNLATLADPGDARDDTFSYHGLTLPAHHQSILFGDGGVMKSFLMLALAVFLALRQRRVALFDWELHARDHWRRLSMLCSDAHELPSILHVRCTRPLVQECERLRRVVRTEEIAYAFYDSAGFATQGAPESAEAALAYFQATSLIGIGGLHLAHITKNSDQNDQKPFGSSFWFNSARCCWNVKLEQDTSGDRARQKKTLGLFNRKANLDDPYKPVGLAVTFDEGRVTFAPTDLRDTVELVKGLKLHERIAAVVKHQPLALATIAEEVGHSNIESLDRIVRRHKHLFTRVSDADGIQRIALVEKRRT
jgi:hypothetical protein